MNMTSSIPGKSWALQVLYGSIERVHSFCGVPTSALSNEPLSTWLRSVRKTDYITHFWQTAEFSIDIQRDSRESLHTPEASSTKLARRSISHHLTRIICAELKFYLFHTLPNKLSLLVDVHLSTLSAQRRLAEAWSSHAYPGVPTPEPRLQLRRLLNTSALYSLVFAPEPVTFENIRFPCRRHGVS